LNSNGLFNFIGLVTAEEMFDLTLEFNPNVSFLHLPTIDFVPTGEERLWLPWLLRFLSTFDASNKLEHIQLEVRTYASEFREVCSASCWGQVDRILAEKFLKLQQLNVRLCVSEDADEDLTSDEFSQCMLEAHPLLMERGVSVDVSCGRDIF
jgi:hypothetical protein